MHLLVNLLYARGLASGFQDSYFGTVVEYVTKLPRVPVLCNVSLDSCHTERSPMTHRFSLYGTCQDCLEACTTASFVGGNSRICDNQARQPGGTCDAL